MEYEDAKITIEDEKQTNSKPTKDYNDCSKTSHQPHRFKNINEFETELRRQKYKLLIIID